MTDDQVSVRKNLTFEQAEGIHPIPAQLQLKEISQQLRSLLWKVVHDSIQRSCRYSMIMEEWRNILYGYHVEHLHLMADDFNDTKEVQIRKLRKLFDDGNYAEILGFIQFVLRCKSLYRFKEEVEVALIKSKAAYRIIDGITIIPIASEVEKNTLEKAFQDLSTIEFNGARAHLSQAAIHLTAGNYADSIRESIHAVESVVRILEPSGEFSKALAKLENSSGIHPALKNGFRAIYGYTCEEGGIRHPLIDGSTANVDEAEALFMIGACASFVSYIISKARKAGLIK